MAVTRNLAGEVLPGGYRLQEMLGEGRFAQVYRGTTSRQEPVAVKVLHELSSNAQRLFVREVKIMRQLPVSPNRVRYVGDGEMAAGGPPFLVMELVEGQNLRQRVKSSGPWPLPQAVGLLVQLCDALQGLHSLGVVHRDLKPDNVLLTREMQVKLSDFGLVRDAQGLLKLFEDQDILQGQDFTSDFDRKLVLGTPDYMAPEQFSDPLQKDDQPQQTDTWTDVYALGLIFYETVTGRRLWNVRATGGSPDKLQTMREYIRLRCGAGAEAHVVQPVEVPDALWDIVSRTVRQDPKRRHRDVEILRQELVEYQATGFGSTDFDDRATEAVNVRHMTSLDPEFAHKLKEASARSRAAAAARPVPQQRAADVPSTPPPVAQGTESPPPPPPPPSPPPALEPLEEPATRAVSVPSLLKASLKDTPPAPLPPPPQPDPLEEPATRAVSVPSLLKASLKDAPPAPLPPPPQPEPLEDPATRAVSVPALVTLAGRPSPGPIPVQPDEPTQGMPATGAVGSHGLAALLSASPSRAPASPWEDPDAPGDAAPPPPPPPEDLDATHLVTNPGADAMPRAAVSTPPPETDLDDSGATLHVNVPAILAAEARAAAEAVRRGHGQPSLNEEVTAPGAPPPPKDVPPYLGVTVTARLPRGRTGSHLQPLSADEKKRLASSLAWRLMAVVVAGAVAGVGLAWLMLRDMP